MYDILKIKNELNNVLKNTDIDTFLKDKYNFKSSKDNNNDIYEKTISFRSKYKNNDFINIDFNKFKEIFDEIIVDWGGIKSNKETTINELFNNFIKFLNKDSKYTVKFKGISSFSKILSFFSPNEYFIYDSRVIFSLNWLIFRTGGNTFFKMPPGRNSLINDFNYNVLLNILVDNIVFLDGGDFYKKYNDLIIELNKRLFNFSNSNSYKVEMLLFSIFDDYIIDDISNYLKK